MDCTRMSMGNRAGILPESKAANLRWYGIGVIPVLFPFPEAQRLDHSHLGIIPSSSKC
jgi:hypothetical protein